MRARFFGPRRSTAARPQRLLDELRRASARSTSTSATRDGVERVFERHRARPRAGRSTPPRSRRTTGRRSDPHDRLQRQRRSARSTCSRPTRHVRPDATFIFTSTNKVYGDRPNFLPLEDIGERLELPDGPPVLPAASTRRCRSTARMHSLFGVSKAAADLHGPGVRALLRHADRLLPRRLPDRPVARRRAAPRLPRLPHEVHGDRRAATPSSATTASRSATTSTRATSSAPSRRSTRAPRAAAVYNLGGGRASNCSMLEAIAACERIAGRELDWELSDQARDRRPPLVDLRPVRVRARLPGLAAARTTSRRRCARSTTTTSSTGRRAAAMKLSVVIPAHNEAEVDRADRRRGRRRAARQRAATTRSSSSTTRRPTGRRAVVARAGRARPAHPRAALALRERLRVRGPRRARRLRGRRGGDRHGRRLGRPARPRALRRAARARATTARSARASCRAARSLDYPRFKLAVNRIVNFGIRVLFRHGYDDTTNAFKAYRREVIESVQPLVSHALQPDGRAAAEGDHPRPLVRDRADLVDATGPPASRSSRCARWARATCSSCCSPCSSTTCPAATTGGRATRTRAASASGAARAPQREGGASSRRRLARARRGDRRARRLDWRGVARRARLGRAAWRPSWSGPPGRTRRASRAAPATSR